MALWKKSSFVHKFWIYRKFLTSLLTPLIFLPLLLHTSSNQVSSCGYVMCVMGVFWCTEAIPIPLTAMIPIFLFPMLGVLTAQQVCAKYMKDIMMMFIGGLLLALAIEKVNLHKRIALNILLAFGTNPKSLVMGFGVSAWFLSMWLSNVATMTLMLPIVEALLTQIEELNKKKYKYLPLGTEQELEVIPLNIEKEEAPNNLHNYEYEKIKEDSIIELEPEIIHRDSNDTNDKMDELESPPMDISPLAKALTLSVGYSGKLGGMAMLTGTPPNIILKGFVDDLWAAHGFSHSPITFATWIVYAFPISIIFMAFIILWLQIFYLGPRNLFCRRNTEEAKQFHRILQEDRASLGKLSYRESVTLVLLVILVTSWFFLDPGFITGWETWFPEGYISSAVPSVAVSILLFIIPEKISLKETQSVQPILDWSTVQHRMPWMVIFIFGGSMALADAALQSGLSSWLGSQLMLFSGLPQWVMLCVICLIVAFMTEMVTNTAACTFLVPVVTAMAEAIGLNPLYLALPVTIAAEFAFMLPTSAISTTVLLTTGRITIQDMMKAGFILNFVGTVIVIFATHTWGMAFFNLDTKPWTDDVMNFTSTTTADVTTV